MLLALVIYQNLKVAIMVVLYLETIKIIKEILKR